MSIPSITNSEFVSPLDNIVVTDVDRKVSVVWTVPHFGKYVTTGEEVVSDVFSIGGKCCEKWRLVCYPCGIGKEYQSFVSLFLYSSHRNEGTFKLSLLDSHGNKFNILKEVDHIFEARSDWGFKEFISREKLLEEKENLLPNDCLIIRCTVKTMMVMKNRNFTQLIQKGVKKMKIEVSNHVGALFSNPSLSDIKLLVSGKKINAHKCILAARCPAFKRLLKPEAGKAPIESLVLEDMNLDVAREMLQFIYSGKAPNVASITEELFFAARKFELTDLERFCEIEMARSINIENVLDLYLFAINHNLKCLESNSFSFAVYNFDFLKTTPSFEANKSNPHILNNLIDYCLRNNENNAKHNLHDEKDN